MAASASDEDDITKLFEKAEQTLNNGDANGWASLFSADAVEMPPDEPPLFGIDAIRARDDAFMENFDDEFSLNIESMRISGDLAVVRYSYEESWTPKADGKTNSATGQTLVVLERIDGSWKFTDLIWAHVLAD
jgi:uncharacterized protein (TIGR02246 family)